MISYGLNHIVSCCSWKIVNDELMLNLDGVPVTPLKWPAFPFLLYSHMNDTLPVCNNDKLFVIRLWLHLLLQNVHQSGVRYPPTFTCSLNVLTSVKIKTRNTVRAAVGENGVRQQHHCRYITPWTQAVPAPPIWVLH